MAENTEMKYKEFLKLYLYNVKQIICQCLLNEEAQTFGAVGEQQSFENATMITLLENWMNVVS